MLKAALDSIQNDKNREILDPFLGDSNDISVNYDGYTIFIKKAENNNETTAPGRTLTLKVNFDGSFHLFYGRAAAKEGNVFTFFSENVIATCLQFLEISGLIFEKIAYYGNINIGLGLTGLKGSKIYSKDFLLRPFTPSVTENRYLNTCQIFSNQMRDDKLKITQELLTRLIDTYTQRKFDVFKPFSERML